MSRSSIMLGYHGCDREIGERVLAGAIDLRPSASANDWLAESVFLSTIFQLAPDLSPSPQ